MKNSYLKIAIIIIVGMLLNIPIISGSHWPFFFDTIGTIFVTFALGAVPGIICATLYQILATIFFAGRVIDVFYVLVVYGAIGIVLIFKDGIYTAKSNSSIIIILLTISVFMALEVSIAGGLVNTFLSFIEEIFEISSAANYTTDFYKSLLIKLNLSEFSVNILSRIPGNIVASPVSVFSGWGLFVLYRRILNKI